LVCKISVPSSTDGNKQHHGETVGNDKAAQSDFLQAESALDADNRNCRLPIVST